MGKKGGKKKGGTAEPVYNLSRYLTKDVDDVNHVDKHALYQRSVQTPKGDISYLLKFYLNYVGNRIPLHLREDFCGTALICSEWLKVDARRTAVGIDLDEDALRWGFKHNFFGHVNGSESRMCFLSGNVLEDIRDASRLPLERMSDSEEATVQALTTSDSGALMTDQGEISGEGKSSETALESLRVFPADIVCAFNFSTCCLHSRSQLVLYFKHVLRGMNSRGSVFAMDLYGGASSEIALKLKRTFQDFTYTWEQEEFDVLTRMTRISIHFKTPAKTVRRAFSYQWRLWTIPEVKECLLEAGFRSVQVWMREMPQLSARQDGEDDAGQEHSSKYEEVDSFLQCDAWNAYIVGSK